MSEQCRIHITLEGLEWSMYNRIPAYDDLLSRMDLGGTFQGARRSRALSQVPSYDGHKSLKKEDSKTTRGEFSTQMSFYAEAEAHSGPFYPSYLSTFLGPIRVPIFLRDASASIKRQLPVLEPKNLLPLSFKASRAAIICGNRATRNHMIFQFTEGHGTYGIVQVRQVARVWTAAH